MDTLPFICCSFTAGSPHALSVDAGQKTNFNIRGFHQNPCQADNSLVSFCEALATATLQQGLREGLNQVMDSNFLKVKMLKPPRKQCLFSGTSVLDFEPNGVNVKMSIAMENSGVRNEKEMGVISSSYGDVCAAKSGNNVEFVALDVQALEQMKAPCSFKLLEYNRDRNSVVISVPSPKRMNDIVRSATDFDIKSKRNESSHRRLGYDPCSIYDITEYPVETTGALLTGNMRSASASGHLSSTPAACAVPQVPQDVSFLNEPLLLVGPKLEWEGYVKARKISNAKRRKRRQQQMTPQELKKMTRVVIGYTLAFFLLVIVTFYIVYFV